VPFIPVTVTTIRKKEEEKHKPRQNNFLTTAHVYGEWGAGAMTDEASRAIFGMNTPKQVPKAKTSKTGKK
jgi:hypothetical protein